MDKFFIVTNPIKDKDSRIGKELRDYLQEKGKSCFLGQCREIDKPDKNYIDPESVPKDTQGMIVLGGDGTLLHVARDTAGLNIPIIGINIGNLGYLAEVSKKNIAPAIDALLDDRFQIEHRMMLTGTLFCNNKRKLENVALNDIYISKTGLHRMIEADIFVDGAKLNSYFADGIIVASPTGSTGYSLSAGGPIVEPGASLFTITPLAPHTLINRSVILNSKHKIKLVLGKDKYGNDLEASLVFDGNEVTKISTGDYIEISKAQGDIQLIKIYEHSFMDVLNIKMSGL